MGHYTHKIITAQGNQGDLDKLEDMFRQIKPYADGVVRDQKKKELKIYFETPFQEDLYQKAVSLSKHYKNLVITFKIIYDCTGEFESWCFLGGKRFAYYNTWENDTLMHDAKRIIEGETNTHEFQTT